MVSLCHRGFVSQQPVQPHRCAANHVSSVGKGFVVSGLGMCPHVHVVLRPQGWQKGGTCSTEPPESLPSALLLAATARVSGTSRALPRTNSSGLSSLSSTNNALLFPKDYSPCSSTIIKALQLRTGPTEAAPRLKLLPAGRRRLAMKALSSLAASGTVIRLICAGSTVGAIFLPQAPPAEKGDLPSPLWCRIKEENWGKKRVLDTSSATEIFSRL